MKGGEKIYIICSMDKALQKLAECVRRDHANAEIIAVVPRGQVLTERERGYLDGTLESSSGTMSALGGLTGLLRLAGVIRAAQPAEVVLQFESLKLRLFGIACRPQRLRAWLGNGQRLVLPRSVTGTLADLAAHRARGYGVTLKAMFHAYVLGAKSEPRERRGK